MRCKDGIVWGELNPAVKRKVRSLEKNLERKAYTLWSFENPKGDKFLFARFGKKNESDNIIATIAVYDRRVIGCWNSLL